MRLQMLKPNARVKRSLSLSIWLSRLCSAFAIRQHTGGAPGRRESPCRECRHYAPCIASQSLATGREFLTSVAFLFLSNCSSFARHLGHEALSENSLNLEIQSC